MKKAKNEMKEKTLDEKTEALIAIGAAAASNCIPCFEHIYENAITSGITLAEIRRASDIAAQVKMGAHRAITNTVNEYVGEEEPRDLPCQPSANKACCC